LCFILPFWLLIQNSNKGLLAESGLSHPGCLSASWRKKDVQKIILWIWCPIDWQLVIDVFEMHAASVFRLVGKEQVVWKKWSHLTWTGSSERPWRLSSISAVWTLRWPGLEQVLDTLYSLPEGTGNCLCGDLWPWPKHTVCPASSLHFLVSHVNFSSLSVFALFPMFFTHDSAYSIPRVSPMTAYSVPPVLPYDSACSIPPLLPFSCCVIHLVCTVPVWSHHFMHIKCSFDSSWRWR